MDQIRNDPQTPLEGWINHKIGWDPTGLKRTALEAYQLEKLNRVLQTARERSAFYRQRLAAAPDKLDSLEDLHHIPFTTADDLRRWGMQFLCVSQDEIQRVVTLHTSGTTGDPKRLYFTAADQELTIDFFQQGMSVFTRAGDRVMILLPYERPGSVGDLLATALERLGAKAVRYGPVSDPQPALAFVQSQKISGLVGAPTHLLAMVRFFDQNPAPQAWKPSQVLLSTDYASPAIVSAIQSIWKAEVYDHYGMTEMGLGGGVDCQARIGYHLREADLYFEVIDPQSGEPLPMGQEGEIVFTTLTRQGMPLVRYRTGDLSQFIPQPCPCGTCLKTMQHIRRRLTNLAPIGNPPGLPLSMADLDDALFPIPAVLNFSATLGGSRSRSHLDLELVTLPGAPEIWRQQVDPALEQIPALEQARQADTLEIRISAQPYPHAAAGSLAKRKIVDQRRIEYA